MKPRLIAVMAALAALPACSGIPGNFIEPQVNLQEVVVRGVGLTGGSMDLVVDVYNPNSFTLRGTKLELGFDVEGSHVGDITYTDEFSIQEGDTTTVTLPLRFNWDGVSAAVRAALGYGDIPYTMRGQATVATPFGDRVVPFTRQGRAPLTRSRSATGSASPSTTGR
jgi:LEA14-like dessication related protein